MREATELLSNLGRYLVQFDVSSFLQGVGAIWVAVVATLALRTWRKQLHAEKQLAFIDELTDTVHEFILLMAPPTSLLAFAKIGIDAHKGVAFGFEKYENAEAIAYITKNGRSTSERISEKLSAVKPVLGKMQALAVKGQVLGLPDYPRCQNACVMLAWTHDHIEAFSALIGDPNMNWDNPLVQKSLSNLPKFDPERVNNTLQEQNMEFIVFAKQAYEKATR